MSAQTLLRNVRLVTVGDRPATDEPVDLRIAGGVIVAAEPGLVPEAEDEVFDAAGRWAIPGLWDQHVHMAQWADVTSRLDMSGTAGPDEVVARVARHIDTLSPGGTELVSGYGHRAGAWERRPTVAELDAVSGHHPVVLISGDAHHGWLNSAALALLGVPPRDTPLDENEWFPVFGRLSELPGAGHAHQLAYREAVRRAATLGVVGITDMEWGHGRLEWPDRWASGIDSLRVRVATYADGLDAVLAEGLRTGSPLDASPEAAASLVRMGPLKVISDGSINTRTAHCCAPYAVSDDLEFPLGVQNNSAEELVDLMSRAHAGGLDSAIHTIGDAALTIALDAFEATGARGGIEHAQLVRLEDLPRMVRLGVRASVQPAHLLDDREVTERLWPDRTDRCFVFASMLDAGVDLALGSDAPVAALDPWLAMAAAVHRGPRRDAWHPEQSLTPAQALAASTDGQGTLGVGSRGDVVLLDRHPWGRKVWGDDEASARGWSFWPPEPAWTRRAARRLRDIGENGVAATFVAGRPTHLTL